MLELKWSAKASRDLFEIQRYIERENPLAAQSVRETIESGAELLTFVPYAFRTGRVAGTREYPVHPNYILVYKVGSAKVRILRVIHAKRQYP